MPSIWKRRYGVGPHTISVPRIRHADDIDADAFDNGIDDDIFAEDGCLYLRIAVPYTGMIISTRETQSNAAKGCCTLAFRRSAAARAPAWAAMMTPEPDDAKLRAVRCRAITGRWTRW